MKHYDITKWEHLFNEIAYGYNVTSHPYSFTDKDIEYITFDKLTLSSNGQIEYKGNITTFNPKLWYRVKMIFRTFDNSITMDILYGE